MNGWKAHLFEGQLYSTVVVGCCKLLLVGNKLDIPLHRLLLLLARGLSMSAVTLYLDMKTTLPDGPLGKKAHRKWLMADGCMKLVAAILLYTSLASWCVSEYVCFSFVTPLLSQFFQYVFGGGLFPSVKQVGLLVSFVGVALMAQVNNRAWTVTLGLLGTIANSFNWSVINTGEAAHPVISGFYFAVCVTSGSLMGLMFLAPDSGVLPQSSYQWGVLVVLWIADFLAQFHKSVGVERVKTQRVHPVGAVLHKYTGILYGILFDVLFEQPLMNKFSIIGSTLIVVCTMVIFV